MSRRIRKRGRRRFRVLVGIVLLAGIGAFVFLNLFKIKTVTVEGNVQYTKEEITEEVKKHAWAENSLAAWFMYRNGKKLDIPFINSWEIEYVAPGELHVVVYEKAMVACFEFLGEYLYIDKDGTLVEQSKERLETVPLIKGISFQEVVMYEPLTVEDDKIFSTIASLTQSLQKNEIIPDTIQFSPKKAITLMFDKVKVQLGTDDRLEEKIIRLKDVLPKMENLSGILHLEEYDGENGDLLFEVNTS